MLEFLTRVRDIILAVALAWVGVSIQAEQDQKSAQAAAEGRPAFATEASATPSTCPGSAVAVQCVDGACPDR
jgi:hypothetical protein